MATVRKAKRVIKSITEGICTFLIVLFLSVSFLSALTLVIPVLAFVGVFPLVIVAASYIGRLWQTTTRKAKDFYNRLDINAASFESEQFNEKSIA
jgi:hypothetical protein